MLGLFSLEKALRRPDNGLLISKVGLKEEGRLFIRVCNDSTRGNSFEQKWQRLDWLAEKILYWEGGEAWTQAAQRIGGCPITDSAQARLSGALGSLIWQEEALPVEGSFGLGWKGPYIPPKPFCDPVSVDKGLIVNLTQRETVWGWLRVYQSPRGSGTGYLHCLFTCTCVEKHYHLIIFFMILWFHLRKDLFLKWAKLIPILTLWTEDV